MMLPLRFLVVASLLLSGCASAPDEPTQAPSSTTTITDPSQGRMNPTLGDHLHDYWGGKDRLVILEADVEVLGWTTFGNGLASAATFYPEPGFVVPQGTSAVDVTVDWTDGEPTNLYGPVELWIKSAADREAVQVGPAERGGVYTIESTNDRNDLPHQVLSAWEVHWRIGPDPAAGGVLTRFNGVVSVKMEAVRGLEIPVYPGHPDRWAGATELALFEGEGTTAADGDMTSPNYRCYLPCPPRLAPADGVVVPVDADHIVLVLERDAQLPTRLGLTYHGAASRDWIDAVPAEETATSRTYVLPLDGGGDGPYAKQSQWEFQLVIDEPAADGAAAEAYRVSATAYRFPA